jgi:MtrB/PioB family decaheme-associated outer membrane protein
MRTLATAALALTLGAALAHADDETQTYGSVTAGALGSGISSQNAWKLREYRDLNDGPLLGLDLKRRGADDWLDLFGENIGRDDQRIQLKGGRYDTFRYELFDDNLRHNWTFGARTPYSGIGTANLTAALPNLNSATWHAFDFQKKRGNTGGNFEMWNGSPWFVRVDANEVRERGLQLIAGANGTSPGNGFTDKPFPVDYTTQNASIEAGYATRQAQFSVSALHSTFQNANETLRWRNQFFGGQDTTWLPPSNEYSKLGLNGMLKRLPFESTLAGRLTISQATSSAPVAATVLNTGGVFSATNPDHSTFNGDVVHKTGSLSLHSNWSRDLDSRIYWNWTRKDNRSTEVTFVAPPAGVNCGGGSCVAELLSYNRNNFGTDVGYRLNPTNRVVLGLDLVNLHRNRVDFDRTHDTRVSAEWRNTSLDWLGTRLKYQYLQRRSHFLEGSAGTGPTDPAFLDRFIARFDASNVDQHLVKLIGDIRPAELTDLGIEAIYKKNNFKDTVLGRKDDERAELYGNASYGDPKKLRAMVFADVELVRYESLHRNISVVPPAVPTTGPNTAFDPFSAPACTGANCNYNWGANNRDRSWLLGFGADWLPQERLKFTGSAIWQWTHGAVDFDVQRTPNAINPRPTPIGNFDNTQRFTLNVKGAYALTKSVELTGGYAFERYRYSDIALDKYRYTIGAGNGASYLSGAYAFPNYTANIVYTTATLKF